MALPSGKDSQIHEQRSLAAYSPWSRKKSDMTEQDDDNELFIFSRSHVLFFPSPQPIVYSENERTFILQKILVSPSLNSRTKHLC